MTLKKFGKAAFDPLNLSGLFDDKVPAPAPIPAPEQLPSIPEPAVAPVADDQARQAKARRKSAIVRQRSGRLSTIDTAPQGTALG